MKNHIKQMTKVFEELAVTVSEEKQSERCWNSALHAHLVKMNFEQLHSDPCIYKSKTELLSRSVC